MRIMKPIISKIQNIYVDPKLPRTPSLTSS